MNILEELDKITKLKVSHQKAAIKLWHETYYDEKPVEWFKARQEKRELQYDFQIKESVCEIRIYLLYWGWGDFITCSASTTEEACKKAIKLFYKTYRKID